MENRKQCMSGFDDHIPAQLVLAMIIVPAILIFIGIIPGGWLLP